MSIAVDDLPGHGKIQNGCSRSELTTKMLKAFKDTSIIEAYGFINPGKVGTSSVLDDTIRL